MVMKKAQSAMEYLMTYGWAILIVIIVAAALYMLGVFNPSTYTQSTAVGFQGFQVPTGGWQLNTNGDLIIILRNMQGASINVTNVTATYQNTLAYNDTYVVLNPNQETTFNISSVGSQTSGSPYSVSTEIYYTNLDTGLTFKTTGTVSGTVS